VAVTAAETKFQRELSPYHNDNNQCAEQTLIFLATNRIPARLNGGASRLS
jgi:hypothetical protein